MFCFIFLSFLSFILFSLKLLTSAPALNVREGVWQYVEKKKRNLSSCPQDVKETAYKGLVRPILEYASPVWDPHGIVVQEEL